MPTSPVGQHAQPAWHHRSAMSNVYRGERNDLQAWQAYYRLARRQLRALRQSPTARRCPPPAEDVLRALLSPSTWVLGDRGACRRGDAGGCFSRGHVVSYGAVECIVAVRRIVQTLALRADAHLATGRERRDARRDLETDSSGCGGPPSTEPRSFLNAALGCNHLEMALQVDLAGLARPAGGRRTIWRLISRAACKAVDLLVGLPARCQRAAGRLSSFLIDGLQDGRNTSTSDLFSPGR